MNESTAPAVEAPEAEGSLKGFLFAAVLWLPLAFFFWYMLRSVIVAAPVRIAAAVLAHWTPGVFGEMTQQFHELVYTIFADVGGVQGLPSTQLAIDLQTVNVLQYCYNVPVLIGLVMATPMSWGRTFVQIGGGWLVLVPLQALGVASEMLKTAALDLGAAVAAALTSAGYPELAGVAGDAALKHAQAQLASHGLGLEVIAMLYQFGYLILPPVSAVIVWILFNRRFIEALTGRGAEPPRASAV